MSTKTTFKRIALVTVAALGFGVLTSVAPASAAYTGSMSVSTTSVTVVGTGTTTNAGYFYVDTFDEAGLASPLTTAESISVTVVARPQYRADGTTASTAADLTIGTFTRSTIGANIAAVTGAQAAQTASNQIPNGTALATAFASSNLTATSATAGAASNRYYFGVYPTATTAIDSGEFTLRVRLLDANTFTTDVTLKVKFVSSAADSGAKIAVASAGGLYYGQALTYTTGNYVKATLTDANGGRVVLGRSLTGVTYASFAPVLSATTVDADGVVTSPFSTPADTGVAATDMVASTSTYSGGITNYALSQEGNGVYGINSTSITSAAATTSVIRVRYGATSTDAAIIIYGATSIIDGYTDLTLTAAGVLASDQAIKSDVATTTAYTLPTSAKSAKLRINVDSVATANVADVPVTVKTVWSGNYATANVLPATTTITTTNSDASGMLI